MLLLEENFSYNAWVPKTLRSAWRKFLWVFPFTYASGQWVCSISELRAKITSWKDTPIHLKLHQTFKKQTAFVSKNCQVLGPSSALTFRPWDYRTAKSTLFAWTRWHAKTSSARTKTRRQAVWCLAFPKGDEVYAIESWFLPIRLVLRTLKEASHLRSSTIFLYG